MTERFFLYNDMEDTKTRFVSFVGEHQRYDLAITQSKRHFGKALVLNMQGNRYAIIGEDDLKEEGYLEYAFGFSEEEAAELKDFLYELI
jgi:hypothetical protein